jgi:hypothetical protein
MAEENSARQSFGVAEGGLPASAIGFESVVSLLMWLSLNFFDGNWDAI